MSEERRDARAALADLETEMRDWSRTHPEATLEAIEQEVDCRLRAIRAQMLVSVAGVHQQEVGACPDCGVPLVRRGTRTRHLRTDGDQPLPLDRPYASCPVCGRGLFPPG